jgi:hypothetical protein
MCVALNSQLHFGQPGVRMCCPELPVTFWAVRSEDVLSRASNHFLDSQEWGCVALSSQLLFGQPGVRMCWSQLLVTFWTARSDKVLFLLPVTFCTARSEDGCPQLPVTFLTARSEDVLFRAPSPFLDSQELGCVVLSSQSLFWQQGVRRCCSCYRSLPSISYCVFWNAGYNEWFFWESLCYNTGNRWRVARKLQMKFNFTFLHPLQWSKELICTDHLHLYSTSEAWRLTSDVMIKQSFLPLSAWFFTPDSFFHHTYRQLRVHKHLEVGKQTFFKSPQIANPKISWAHSKIRKLLRCAFRKSQFHKLVCLIRKPQIRNSTKCCTTLSQHSPKSRHFKQYTN